MGGLEVLCSIEVNFQKLNHFFKVKLFLFIELKSFDRNLYPNSQFRATCPENNFGMLIDDSTFNDGLIWFDHRYDFHRYFIKI